MNNLQRFWRDIELHASFLLGAVVKLLHRIKAWALQHLVIICIAACIIIASVASAITLTVTRQNKKDLPIQIEYQESSVTENNVLQYKDFQVIDSARSLPNYSGYIRYIRDNKYDICFAQMLSYSVVSDGITFVPCEFLYGR